MCTREKDAIVAQHVERRTVKNKVFFRLNGCKKRVGLIPHWRMFYDGGGGFRVGLRLRRLVRNVLLQRVSKWLQQHIVFA
jgi:hypothetical protein